MSPMFRSFSVMRIAVMLCLLGPISACYALTVASPTEEESLNQFDTSMARRQSYEQNAELATRVAEPPMAEQQAALQSLRTAATAPQPEAEPEAAEPEVPSSNPWLAASPAGAIPRGLVLALGWLA